MGTDLPPTSRLRLRDLPFAVRLVLSAFLICIGIGYCAALVQLHFQHASPGNPLPTRDDVVRRFHGPTGEKPKPKLQTVLEAEESRPFNGSGTMRLAFTVKSASWESTIKNRARKAVGRRSEPTPEQLKQAEDELRKERDTERLALVEWAEKGGDKLAYEEDSFCVSDSLANLPLDEKYVGETPETGGRTVKVQSLITDRCARCHSGEGKGEGAQKYPLEKYEQVAKYLKVEQSQAISKEALIQSTHVHLLSFSMLYLLTGVIFAFSSLPGLVRVIIAPLPLVAQVADIACWWLTRIDPVYADGIVIAGGVVAAGLGLQIVLSLFSMYGKAGKALLLVLFVAGGLAGWQAKERYIDPYLAAEKPAVSISEK